MDHRSGVCTSPRGITEVARKATNLTSEMAGLASASVEWLGKVHVIHKVAIGPRSAKGQATSIEFSHIIFSVILFIQK
jgi:hypothetical protein